ncbi:MAG: hypothetical protein ABIZ49_12895 [Opitutaceae bacterium]
MLSAFEFANRAAGGRGGRQGGGTAPGQSGQPPGPRYDVKHEWGDGNHSDLHGGTLLPDILRWMFRDYAK